MLLFYTFFISRKSRVCSKHFLQGRPTYRNPVPSLEMGYKSATMCLTGRKPPTLRLAKVKSSTDLPLKSPLDDHGYTCTEDQATSHALPTSPLVSPAMSPPAASSPRKAKPKSAISIKPTNKDAMLNTSLVDRLTANDTTIRTVTGVSNVALFNSLLKLVTPDVSKLRYWKKAPKVVATKSSIKKRMNRITPGPSKKLTPREELLLVLMKLRNGLTTVFISRLFGISTGLCSRIVITWIKLLSKKLRALIFWPDRESIRKMIPSTLGRQYRNLRTTIDCTEIWIQKPRNLRSQAETWSDYKKHNTIKYLVAIAPNGHISYLSKGWGGRTSDRHVVASSGFLDLIDPGDLILADRGFAIHADVLKRHATLEIPPPSSGWEQHVSDDVKKTKRIANTRIHVERAIGRLKVFRILAGTIPIPIVTLLDDIVIVCAALCNLQKPLVGK